MKYLLLVIFILVLSGCYYEVPEKYDPVVFEKCGTFIDDETYEVEDEATKIIKITDEMVATTTFATTTLTFVSHSASSPCLKQYHDRMILSERESRQTFYYDNQGNYYDPKAEQIIEEFKKKYNF